MDEVLVACDEVCWKKIGRRCMVVDHGDEGGSLN